MANDLSPIDLDYATRTVLAEGGDPASIAHVIHNRLQDGSFGSGVRGVVTAPGQFEPWGLPASASNHPSRYDPKSQQYKNAADVVRAVFSGQDSDPTGGATYFLNRKIVE